MLSILIHIGQRDSVSHSGIGTKYLSMILVSILSLALISMYLFMGYTVTRITEAKRKYFLLEVKDMEDEPYRFWLEDKKPSGNIFQRHFNLLLLLKDVFVCVTLYVFYTSPAILITIISIGQAFFNCVLYAYPPLIRPLSNCLLITTQSFYMLLNLLFMINIYGDAKISDNTRYYFIGFGMISVVLCIILANIGVNFYSTVVEWRKKCKKRLSERRRVQQSELSRLKSAETKSLNVSKVEGSIEPDQNMSLNSSSQQDQTLLMADKQAPPSEPVIENEGSLAQAVKAEEIESSVDQKLATSKIMPPTVVSRPQGSVGIRANSNKKNLLHTVKQKKKLQ